MQLEKLSDAEYDSMVLTIIKAARVGSFRGRHKPDCSNLSRHRVTLEAKSLASFSFSIHIITRCNRVLGRFHIFVVAAFKKSLPKIL